MNVSTRSRRADRDLVELYAYGFEKLGPTAADAYAESLHACFERLALNPRMGRTAESAGAGLRRFEHRRHVIFYEVEPDGVRILHERSTRGIDL